MKRVIPALALTGLMAVGCQQEPAGQQATQTGSSAQTGYEQPTTPPPAFDTTGTQAQQVEPVDQIERIPMEEYLVLRDAGEVVTIDVRSSQYFVESHIPGAINIPAGQIVSMIDMIPKGKKIVTYCT